LVAGRGSGQPLHGHVGIGDAPVQQISWDEV
jgi:hypothetical protein